MGLDSSKFYERVAEAVLHACLAASYVGDVPERYQAERLALTNLPNGAVVAGFDGGVRFCPVALKVSMSPEEVVEECREIDEVPDDFQVSDVVEGRWVDSWGDRFSTAALVDAHFYACGIAWLDTRADSPEWVPLVDYSAFE